MSRIIKKLKNNFTVVCNEIVRSKEISNGAKGIYLVLCSLPENWDFKIKGLASISKEGPDAISRQLFELEQWSLVKREIFKTDKGFFDVDYTITDKMEFIENYKRPTPQNLLKKQHDVQEAPRTENPRLENPVQDFPVQENPAYYINKDLIKKRINKEKNNIILHSENEFSQVKEENNTDNVILDNETSNNFVNLILEKFYGINPTLNFGNKTQRKAVEYLVKKFGEEKITKLADYAVSIYGKSYSPTITDPLQLKNKLSALLAFYKKEEDGKNANKWEVI